MDVLDFWHVALAPVRNQSALYPSPVKIRAGASSEFYEFGQDQTCDILSTARLSAVWDIIVRVMGVKKKEQKQNMKAYRHMSYSLTTYVVRSTCRLASWMAATSLPTLLFLVTVISTWWYHPSFKSIEQLNSTQL